MPSSPHLASQDDSGQFSCGDMSDDDEELDGSPGAGRDFWEPQLLVSPAQLNRHPHLAFVCQGGWCCAMHPLLSQGHPLSADNMAQ